jgi:hypothetical protein
MLKHLTLTALFAAMLPVLADTEISTETLTTEVNVTPAGVMDGPAPEQPPQGGGQDCFYGVGPGSNCVRCICADAETRQFQYYCSECIMYLD